jgi:mandelamide amidase
MSTFVRTALAIAAWLLAVPFSAAHDLSDRELAQLGVAEAAHLIRDGRISSVELTQALLKRIRAHPELNALITVDAKSVLEAARRADRPRHRCEPRELGPLHGVPLVLKDNIHVAGLPNTAGTPALRGFVPEDNAPVTQALLDAGAIVLGKTNMHELAFGITSNNAAFGGVRAAAPGARWPRGSRRAGWAPTPAARCAFPPR